MNIALEVSGLARESGRDNEYVLSQRPGCPQRTLAFGRLLDDVDHEAQVDDVGGSQRGIGPVIEVVTAACEPQPGESAQVVAATVAGKSQPVAFVIAAADAKPAAEALRIEMAKTMASFKVPSRVWFVDHFPVTQSANGTKGNPEATAAATPALTPGIGSIGISALTQASTSSIPGSEIPGVPASETSAIDSPDFSRAISWGSRWRALCS